MRAAGRMMMGQMQHTRASLFTSVNRCFELSTVLECRVNGRCRIRNLNSYETSSSEGKIVETLFELYANEVRIWFLTLYVLGLSYT